MGILWVTRPVLIGPSTQFESLMILQLGILVGFGLGREENSNGQRFLQRYSRLTFLWAKCYVLAQWLADRLEMLLAFTPQPVRLTDASRKGNLKYLSSLYFTPL